MKKVVITLACLTFYAAANAQERKTESIPVSNVTPPAAPAAPKADPDAGIFKFKEETHDYGKVPEGPLAECDFEFKNTGKKPIVITEAHGSCGCTVPKWPNEPILPGKKGTIHVAYNTSGRQGPIDKSVTITSNAQQSPMVLHIKGFVEPKPAEAQPAAAPVATPVNPNGK